VLSMKLLINIGTGTYFPLFPAIFLSTKPVLSKAKLSRRIPKGKINQTRKLERSGSPEQGQAESKGPRTLELLNP